jgi:hypothetical protein
MAEWFNFKLKLKSRKSKNEAGHPELVSGSPRTINLQTLRMGYRNKFGMTYLAIKRFTKFFKLRKS